MSYPSDSISLNGARIASIEPASPAAQAGLAAGMQLLKINGNPLRDILDWYWHSDSDELELVVRDTASSSKKTVKLMRNYQEAWGIGFAELIFDGLKRCSNQCSFCFMRMLPEGLRASLYVRDDDYRLSFLQGNFVTLTNLTDEEVERIIEMQLSPLNVSLHAIAPSVRTKMMGSRQQRGIQVLEQLLEAGIEFKAQIVLMPGVNDGAVLAETLAWIAAHPGIRATGIVPYGYTQYADLQQGYDSPESARAIIQQFQDLAPKVQLADEFFLKAWPNAVLSHLPLAHYYDEYPLIEDGIGMLRSWLDGPESDALLTSLKTDTNRMIITGEAFAAFLQELWPEFQDRFIAIRNNFFAGNVSVAGLLTAADIIDQCSSLPAHIVQPEYVFPDSMFNADGLSLDDKTAADITQALATAEPQQT